MIPSSLSENFETTLLRNLIFNEEFTRKTIPFLKKDFFKNKEEIILFNIINNFIVKYNNLPNKEALNIEIANLKNITEEEFKLTKDLLANLEPQEVDQNWLLDTAEKFCKDRAVYNAVLSGIRIIDCKD